MPWFYPLYHPVSFFCPPTFFSTRCVRRLGFGLRSGQRSDSLCTTPWNRFFGYPQFRPGQEAAVSAVLAGRSAAAIFPYRFGQVSLLSITGLVAAAPDVGCLAPVGADAGSVSVFLQRHGIAAGSIDSAQSRDDASDVMARAKSGELKILMISVERLKKNERFRHFFAAGADLATGGGRGPLHL